MKLTEADKREAWENIKRFIAATKKAEELREIQRLQD